MTELGLPLALARNAEPNYYYTSPGTIEQTTRTPGFWFLVSNIRPVHSNPEYMTHVLFRIRLVSNGCLGAFGQHPCRRIAPSPRVQWPCMRWATAVRRTDLAQQWYSCERASSLDPVPGKIASRSTAREPLLPQRTNKECAQSSIGRPRLYKMLRSSHTQCQPPYSYCNADTKHTRPPPPGGGLIPFDCGTTAAAVRT